MELVGGKVFLQVTSGLNSCQLKARIFKITPWIIHQKKSIKKIPLVGRLFTCPFEMVPFSRLEIREFFLVGSPEKTLKSASQNCFFRQVFACGICTKVPIFWSENLLRNESFQYSFFMIRVKLYLIAFTNTCKKQQNCMGRAVFSFVPLLLNLILEDVSVKIRLEYLRITITQTTMPITSSRLSHFLDLSPRISHHQDYYIVGRESL